MNEKHNCVFCTPLRKGHRCVYGDDSCRYLSHLNNPTDDMVVKLLLVVIMFLGLCIFLLL